MARLAFLLYTGALLLAACAWVEAAPPGGPSSLPVTRVEAATSTGAGSPTGQLAPTQPALPTMPTDATTEEPPPTVAPGAPYGVDSWVSLSPDREWIAVVVALLPTGAAESYYTQLRVVKADGSTAWTAVDEWSNWGLGYTVPQPFLWSKDGRTLYFTNEPRPDGCVSFVNGWDLWRLDLATGAVTEAVPGIGLWLALSPDERTLAAIRGQELILHDLADGQERRLDLSGNGLDGGAQAGDITWAPDGSGLLVVVAHDPCAGPGTARSIVRVDMNALTAQTLVRENPREFHILDWPEAGRVRLSDKDGQLWTLDPATGALTSGQ